MSTINAYILRQTMGPLLAAVAIALLVLLTERMLRLLDMVLDTGSGLTLLLQMLAFLVPYYMALALPVAFFIGVLLAFSRLHQNRELDALGAAGVGLRRLVSPVLLLALALSVISAANFAIGQPYARYIYRALVYDVAEAAANVYLQERTFMEVKGVTFMAERIWRNSQDFSGIFIYQPEIDGRSTAITAQDGNLSVAPKGEKSILFLKNGVRMEWSPPPADGSGVAGTTGVLRFDQSRVPIHLVAKKAFRARGEDERELTLMELWRYRNSPPRGVTTPQMMSEFHDRVVRSLSVLFLPFLAVPFARGSRRSRQSIGIAFGLFILVAYNEILNVGKSMASIDRLPPVFGQWLPLVVLAVGSLYLFYRSAYRVPRDGHHLWSPFTAVAELIEALRGGGRLKRQHPE